MNIGGEKKRGGGGFRVYCTVKLILTYMVRVYCTVKLILTYMVRVYCTVKLILHTW